MITLETPLYSLFYNYIQSVENNWTWEFHIKMVDVMKLLPKPEKKLLTCKLSFFPKSTNKIPQTTEKMLFSNNTHFQKKIYNQNRWC